jgi:hypothetical protein
MLKPFYEKYMKLFEASTKYQNVLQTSHRPSGKISNLTEVQT